MQSVACEDSVVRDDWVSDLGDHLPVSPLTALGLLLTACIVLRAVAESGSLLTTIAAIALPLLASSAVVLADRWLVARDVPVRDRLTVFGFGLGGFLAASLVTAVHLLVLHLDGAPVYAPLYLTLLSGTVGVAAGTIAGIYELRQRAAAREARRRQERLDQFASLVSHDLRNPLAVARGRLTQAFETGDAAHLEHVDGALARMDDLIDRSLAIARAEAVVTDPEPVRLATVAADAWETARTDDATLTVVDDRRLEGDRERIRTLLENLFRNAIDHGGSAVTVRVGALEDGRGAGFFVEDDGPGIPPAERESVLEHGYSTAAEGSGLGLAIVRAVADAHGWTITVAESDSGGARFEFA